MTYTGSTSHDFLKTKTERVSKMLMLRVDMAGFLR
jgi:hypothetical protein